MRVTKILWISSPQPPNDRRERYLEPPFQFHARKCNWYDHYTLTVCCLFISFLLSFALLVLLVLFSHFSHALLPPLPVRPRKALVDLVHLGLGRVGDSSVAIAIAGVSQKTI